MTGPNLSVMSAHDAIIFGYVTLTDRGKVLLQTQLEELQKQQKQENNITQQQANMPEGVYTPAVIYTGSISPQYVLKTPPAPANSYKDGDNFSEVVEP